MIGAFSKKVAIISILILLAGFFIAYLGFKSEKSSDTSSVLRDLESRQISSFQDLSDYFKNLAEKEGARLAFEVLRFASLPPNTDLHLLGHVVGDVLYEQEGIGGIKICNNDFRNACSHSIVTGLFFDKGEAALAEISEACRQAPGGSGAYTMCFHGLGHGVLAAVDYDMAKSASYCEKTGAPDHGYNEASQCIGGMVMEIVGGGGHSKNIWEVQRKKYLNISDPLALCRSDFINDRARFMCYDYITPYLFEAVGSNLALPSAEDFKKSFPICNNINLKSDRDACYGGFGKEFVGLVQARDIRRDAVESISDDQLSQIFEWCQLADNKEGQSACMISGANSLYWGGENSASIAIRYCGLISDSYFRGQCFSNLISVALFYNKDINYLESFCGQLPLSYQNDCQLKIRQ